LTPLADHKRLSVHLRSQPIANCDSRLDERRRKMVVHVEGCVNCHFINYDAIATSFRFPHEKERFFTFCVQGSANM
jgi:hypothetical protein